MTNRIDEIHEAWLNWKHNPICKQSDTEWARYQESFADMEHSKDGGESWSKLPWNMKLFSRVLCRLAQADWPPKLDCFGWYNGKIAIAWHDTSTDSEMHIGKYLAIFDQDAKAWEFKHMGFYNLEDGVHQTWFENIGFGVLNRMRPLLKL